MSALQALIEKADKGDKDAQCELGVAYENGLHGAKEDLNLALKLFRLSAAQGNARAQAAAGFLLMNADGGKNKKNEEEAIKFFGLASEQGNASAQYYLAIMHARGDGVVAKDDEKVKLFLRQASNAARRKRQTSAASVEKFLEAQKPIEKKASIVTRSKFDLITPGDYATLSPYKPGFLPEKDVSVGKKWLEFNRYEDVLPYDKTRVKLNNPECDYINANHISYESGSCSLHYLAAQGPIEETVVAHWEMIWENEIHVILMLTTVLDGEGYEKCFQYWPSAVDDEIDYGDVRVVLSSETDYNGYTIRELSVFHQTEFQERTVVLVQFTAWPDHGVPDDPAEFINLLRVMQVQKREVAKALKKTVPPLIHCSAGIGRTGMFMLTEISLAMLRGAKEVVFADIVFELRKQRMNCVQTQEQFDFVVQSVSDLVSSDEFDFSIFPS